MWDKIKVFLLTLIIRSIGRLSTGINMSFKYGFISGKMLDYIYENKPQGKFFIGKILDKIFLENVGWKAIRKRKDNLKDYLKRAIEVNRKNGIKSVILDIASGPGKYLVDVLCDLGEQDIVAFCQDIDQRWLEDGRRQASERGINNIRFMQGDAFNLEELKKVSPRPNIVVSSGFYDWITEDDLIKRSFQYSYEIMQDKGKMIFSNQASHKQMELVSKAFVDFNHMPLRMKIRDPELLNLWAEKTGFKNLETRLDQWGLYSVAMGEKI